jgi:hypothetical protein
VVLLLRSIAYHPYLAGTRATGLIQSDAVGGRL